MPATSRSATASRAVGFPLVLIMGFTASMDWWDPEMVEILAEKHRVLIFDNRGAGLTSAPGEGGFTCEMFAGDTAALMDAVGIGRAHVVGYSMGGLIAQVLALEHPEKVEMLALCATFCGGKDMVPPEPEVMRVLMDNSGGADEMFERTLKLVFPGDFLDANPGFVARFRERYMKAPISASNARRQFAACMDLSTYDRLPEIQAPTLVMTGAGDILVPPQNSRKIAGRIPGARLVEYADSGHGFMSQERDAFIKDLLGFFSS